MQSRDPIVEESRFLGQIKEASRDYVISALDPSLVRAAEAAWGGLPNWKEKFVSIYPDKLDIKVPYTGQSNFKVLSNLARDYQLSFALHSESLPSTCFSLTFGFPADDIEWLGLDFPHASDDKSKVEPLTEDVELFHNLSYTPPTQTDDYILFAAEMVNRVIAQLPEEFLFRAKSS